MGMYVTYMQVALNRLRLYLGTYIHIYMSQKEKKKLWIWKDRSRRRSAGKKEKAKKWCKCAILSKYFLKILTIEVTHSPCLCAPYYLRTKNGSKISFSLIPLRKRFGIYECFLRNYVLTVIKNYKQNIFPMLSSVYP